MLQGQMLLADMIGLAVIDAATGENYGTIKEVHETSLLIEIEGNVTLRIDKNMIVADPANNIPASK